MFKRSLSIIILLFFLISPAYAARELIMGFEGGEAPETLDVWSAVQGTVDIEATTTTPTNGDLKNDLSIEIDPASGASEYIEFNNTDGKENTYQFDFFMSSTPTVDRELFSTYNGTSTSQHVIVNYDSTEDRLELRYSTNDKRCGQSTSENTICATTSDCTEVQAGEATCSADNGNFAVSQTLNGSTWYTVVVKEDASTTNPGEVTLELKIDGESKGKQTKMYGVCSPGGTRAGLSCATTSDCVDSLCEVGSIQNSTQSRFGSSDTVASAVDYNLDNLIIETSWDENFNRSRIRDIHPLSDEGTNEFGSTGCPGGSNHHSCVDDTETATSNDDNSTFLFESTVSQQDIFEMENITLSSDPLETVNAVAAYSGAYQTTTSGTGREFTLRLKNNNGSFSSGVEWDVAVASDTLTGHLFGGDIFETDPDAASWDATSVNDIAESVQYTGTNTFGRITDMYLEVEIDQFFTPTPTVLTDQNSDGEKTVCVIGDSRMNVSDLFTTLATNVTEPDNIFDCARGGATTDSVLVNLTNILNGTATGTHNCAVAKGTIGDGSTRGFCDYALIDLGVNDAHEVPNMPLEVGVCEDNGGADQGKPCYITDGAGELDAEGKRKTYCAWGTAFKTDCDRDTNVCTDCPHSGISCDYTHRVDDGTCTGGDNDGNACQVGEGDCDAGGGSCTDNVFSLNTCCFVGSLNTDGCENGVCVQSPGEGYIFNNYTKIIDQALARTGSQNVVPIVMATYPTANNGLGCWSQPGSTMHYENMWQRQLAEDRGIGWIDLRQELYDNCEHGNYESCMLDAVHLSTPTSGNLNSWTVSIYGSRVVANLIEACLEEDTSFSNNHCGDL